MTKVARLFEEEKIEAVNEAVSETLKSERIRIAKEMMESGDDILKIMRVTKLTRSEVKKLQMLVEA